MCVPSAKVGTPGDPMILKLPRTAGKENHQASLSEKGGDFIALHLFSCVSLLESHRIHITFSRNLWIVRSYTACIENMLWRKVDN